MRFKNIIYVIILVLTTILTSWSIPALVKKMVYESDGYPLMYYSSRLKELCIIDFREMKDAFRDVKGNIYPRSQYDSLLPLMNYRQLAMNGNLPDSLEGHAMDVKVLRSKQVVYRFRPSDVYSPQPNMGVLLEAMPKRGSLSLPGDYFRMDDSEMVFVDSETNSVNHAKSKIFTGELKKKGFEFPAKAFWGNPTVRKPYEEGYFCLDNKGDLFHVKMVNGRPFVKNTGVSKQVSVKWFVMREVSDKRFYGYLFGQNGEFGIIESNEDGGYRFVKMDVRPVDIAKDDITIMGNMLYWTVRIYNSEAMDCYGLKASTLESLSTYHQEKGAGTWDKVADVIFPIILSPVSPDKGYVGFYVLHFSALAWGVSVVLALLVFVFMRKRLVLYKNLIVTVVVVLTGIPGVIALLLLPGNRFE
ncbi:DUF4857 domain-containing protein [Bacteroides caecigallinarum]|uniref:DUF4857 domain-containing protein n=1 Tax=Bacteroides caecigallinarum TaxID=1411144 RepID=UPI00195EE590|nr:DUF4857 domain-containing protein [Bacteroides caecigallinarum]MBM6865485.1 DUF4857 domain-containing protein [Bacteroides caecigallinarum]